jgi:translation initiation factor IF-3
LRRTYRRAVVKPTGPQYRINDRISAEKVRLIDENGEMVGEVSLSDALKRAQAVELDLVEISPKANPPVAKILDFHQFKYQKEKETQKAKAKQKKQEIKGIRLSFRIGDHDKEFRLNQAAKFLDDGHKLKLELQLRGREHSRKDLAAQVIEQFVETLSERYNITVEQPVQKQGGKLSLVCFSTGKKIATEDKDNLDK